MGTNDVGKYKNAPNQFTETGFTNAYGLTETSSTVALRPKDGSLAWHYQHSPGESLDLDEPTRVQEGERGLVVAPR